MGILIYIRDRLELMKRFVSHSYRSEKLLYQKRLFSSSWNVCPQWIWYSCVSIVHRSTCRTFQTTKKKKAKQLKLLPAHLRRYFSCTFFLKRNIYLFACFAVVIVLFQASTKCQLQLIYKFKQSNSVQIKMLNSCLACHYLTDE